MRKIKITSQAVNGTSTLMAVYLRLALGSLKLAWVIIQKYTNK